MQEVMVSIQVKTNTSAPPEKIAELVQRLIDIGQADAAATLEDSANGEEGDVHMATLALDLHIGAPIVVEAPTVTEAAMLRLISERDEALSFVEHVAGLGICGYDKNDGTPYRECPEPSDGYLDSHCCLMELIETARGSD